METRCPHFTNVPFCMIKIPHLLIPNSFLFHICGNRVFQYIKLFSLVQGRLLFSILLWLLLLMLLSSLLIFLLRRRLLIGFIGYISLHSYSGYTRVYTRHTPREYNQSSNGRHFSQNIHSSQERHFLHLTLFLGIFSRYEFTVFIFSPSSPVTCDIVVVLISHILDSANVRSLYIKSFSNCFVDTFLSDNNSNNKFISLTLLIKVH